MVLYKVFYFRTLPDFHTKNCEKKKVGKTILDFYEEEVSKVKGRETKRRKIWTLDKTSIIIYLYILTLMNIVSVEKNESNVWYLPTGKDLIDSEVREKLKLPYTDAPSEDTLTDDLDDALQDSNQTEVIEKISAQKHISEIEKIPILHPPDSTASFTGRTAEREMLTSWLCNDTEHPLLSIRGLGGMGKTSLVWRWFHDDVEKLGQMAPLKQFLWWSFYGENHSFDRFIDYCLTDLLKETRTDTVSLEDKIDNVFRYLQNNEVLLVLDGVERMLRDYVGFGSSYRTEYVEEKNPLSFDSCISLSFASFLKRLANEIVKTKTLVTTRLHPREILHISGVRMEELRELKLEDAVEYFTREGLKGTHTELEYVAGIGGCHPLYLRILSGMIKNDHQFPCDIKQWKQKDPYSELKGENQRHLILELAYNALSKQEQVLISSVSAFRFAVIFEEISHICEPEQRKSLQQMITGFCKRGLLFEVTNKKSDLKKFDMHPLVKTYCYKRLQNRTRIHAILGNYYFPKKTVNPSSIEDFTPFIEYCYHIMQAGGHPSVYHNIQKEHLVQSLYFSSSGNRLIVNLLSGFFEDGAYTKPLLPEQVDSSWLLNCLALSHLSLGESLQALAAYRSALNCGRKKLEHGNISLSLTALGNLAYLQILLGNLENAHKTLIRVYFSSSFNSSPRSEQGASFCWLARAHMFRGSFVKALELLNDAMIIARQMKGTQASSVVSSEFALCFHIQKNPQKTLYWAQQALKNAKKDEISRKEPTVLDSINAQWLIGASYIMLESPEEAEKSLGEALQASRETNTVQIEAKILLELAQCSLQKGNTKEALALAEEALVIAQRSYYIFQQADIHLFLARYWKKKGDLNKAQEHAERAKCCALSKINVRTGIPEAQEENTVWKYLPVFEAATTFLEKLHEEAK